MAVLVSLLSHPAIINVDIVVTKLIQTQLNEFISSTEEETLCDVAAKLVPSVPTHLRS